MQKRYLTFHSLPFLFLWLALGILLLWDGRAQAEEKSTTHPQARRTGIYAALTTGQLMYSDADRGLFEDGWVVGLKAGYDFMKYFGAEAIFKFSGHDANTRSPY